MNLRDLNLIRRAFTLGMEVEAHRILPDASQRYRQMYREAMEFGLTVGEERGRGLKKRKPLKEPK